MQAIEASTLVQQEQGAFDWTANLQQIFNDQNNPGNANSPVGPANQINSAANQNTNQNNSTPNSPFLNTGGLDSHGATTQFGIKRRNRLGGEFDINQSLGRTESVLPNSTPSDQFNSQTALRYEQQLLRGSGLIANNAKIQIAVFNSNTQRVSRRAKLHLSQPKQMRAS